MSTASRRPLKVLISIFTAILCVQCAKQQEAPGPKEGTQSSGGGSVFYSSPKQVSEALDHAIALATVEDTNKNVFVQFWKYSGKYTNIVYINTPAHLFPNIRRATGNMDDRGKDPEEFDSPPLRALKHNKITKLESGDCLKSNGLKHADASVSAFNVSGRLCFSIGNLTRIPPSSLLREVLSLVLHEVTHLGGAQEDEAVAWQKEFSAYFSKRFGDLETHTVSDGIMNTIEEERMLLAGANSMAIIDPKDGRIFATIGVFSHNLQTLPFLTDPLALELKTNPSRPDLLENYTGSVLALIHKITLRFGLTTDFIGIGKPFVTPRNFVPTDKVVETLTELGQDLEKIENNFVAFVSGAP